MMKAIADIRKTVADAAGQLGQARDSAAGNDAAAMFGDGTIMMSSSLGPGRAFNTRVFNNPSPSMSMGPRPQIHVVVGEFPARSQPRFSRALGGGGAAMRSKEDIGYLQVARLCGLVRCVLCTLPTGSPFSPPIHPNVVCTHLGFADIAPPCCVRIGLRSGYLS